MRAWQETACRIVNERWQNWNGASIQWNLDTVARNNPVELQFEHAVVAWEVAIQGEGVAMLTIPRHLAVTLVHATLRMNVEQLAADKELTQLEVSTLEYALSAFIDGCNETQPETPTCVLGKFHEKPDFERIFRGKGDVVLANFRLEGPFGSQSLLWIWPAEYLTELFLSPMSADQSEEAARRLREVAKDVPFEVTVRLGATRLRISELGSLKVGDVILLDQRFSEELLACIGPCAAYLGWAGKIGNRQGFQIRRVLI